jgi:hypothetical protein
MAPCYQWQVSLAFHELFKPASLRLSHAYLAWLGRQKAAGGLARLGGGVARVQPDLANRPAKGHHDCKPTRRGKFLHSR